MNRAGILAYMKSQRVAVQASVTPASAPQAAVVGIAVTDDLEIVFDTLASTRKHANLAKNPRIAFVVGGLLPGDERTVQYEGVADFPEGADLVRSKKAYFEVYPDGVVREKWPGLAYVRARPTWIRYSDYNRTPAEIVELSGDELR